ncbi:MAG TPA: NUDIX hydrolase [Ramlibacter sp.]|nr:NUDIX hydrolase [Ramlibacter sp.]
MANGTAAAPEPISSATVILLRDAAGGPEVFLLKRHGLSDVLGGAYVFPGGKTDPMDQDFVGRIDQPLAPLHAALGEPQLDEIEAAALHVAAIREAFEEAGVLFADVDWARVRPAWDALRAGQSFAEVLTSLQARLTPDRLVPWSRWITPVASLRMRKRFDTRFFVAEVPEGQDPAHDTHETTESAWLAPRAALEQYWARQIDLAPPQILTLAHLSRYGDVASVLADARRAPPPVILPEAFEQDGLRVLCFPGDERHSVPVRALPGTLRLCWRDERFEPVEGYEGLFR